MVSGGGLKIGRKFVRIVLAGDCQRFVDLMFVGFRSPPHSTCLLIDSPLIFFL